MSKVTNKSKSNPNGANQWLADPRQQRFLAYYFDPKSETFANALQSGLKCGFSREYSESILSLMPKWLSDKIGNSSMMLKVERNINELLDLPSQTQVMGAFGPVFKKIKNAKGKKVDSDIPVMALNPSLLKLKSDMTEFVAETIGKAQYSKRASDAGPIFNTIIFSNDQRSRVAKRIIRGGSIDDSTSERESN